VFPPGLGDSARDRQSPGAPPPPGARITIQGACRTADVPGISQTPRHGLPPGPEGRKRRQSRGSRPMRRPGGRRAELNPVPVLFLPPPGERVNPQAILVRPVGRRAAELDQPARSKTAGARGLSRSSVRTSSASGARNAQHGPGRHRLYGEEFRKQRAGQQPGAASGPEGGEATGFRAPMPAGTAALGSPAEKKKSTRATAEYQGVTSGFAGRAWTARAPARVPGRTPPPDPDAG